MSQQNSDLEPIEPSTARELYLEHKAANCSEATVRNYRYRTASFVEWCEEKDIDNLNDISGRDIQTYRLWRRENGDLNQNTMRMRMSAIRVFLKWAASIEAVTENLYDKVLVPSVDPENEHRDEMLEAEHAEDLLDYLSRFHYASNDHVVLALLWETGMRIGAAKSLDVGDVSFENGHLELVHRPTEDTQLKNGNSGERLIALSSNLAKLLADYIAEIRYDHEDEYGRRPLLTTRQGRMSRSKMRRVVYELTAPCFFDDPCPECHRGEDRRCGDAVSPHAVRRGSITHYLSEDVPIDVISDRMNVSRKILEKHYDRRSEEVKLEQRRDYMEKV